MRNGFFSHILPTKRSADIAVSNNKCVDGVGKNDIDIAVGDIHQQVIERLEESSILVPTV